MNIIEKIKTGKVAVSCRNKEQSEIFLSICSDTETNVITFEDFMKEYLANRSK